MTQWFKVIDAMTLLPANTWSQVQLAPVIKFFKYKLKKRTSISMCMSACKMNDIVTWCHALIFLVLRIHLILKTFLTSPWLMPNYIKTLLHCIRKLFWLHHMRLFQRYKASNCFFSLPLARYKLSFSRIENTHLNSKNIILHKKCLILNYF